MCMSYVADPTLNPSTPASDRLTFRVRVVGDRRICDMGVGFTRFTGFVGFIGLTGCVCVCVRNLVGLTGFEGCLFW